jgi:hypothetical protein
MCIFSAQAVKVTVDGITYDDFAGGGMSTIHGDKYIHVSVVGVSNNITGNLFIPEEPGQITEAGFTFTLRVTGIARNAFRDNTKITSVTLPNTVTTIEDNAFRGCLNLSSITFGAGLTTVDSYWAFYDCTALSRFDVAEGNTVYSSLDGVLYNKNRTTLIRYPIGKPNNTFTVPNTVLTIGNNAFADCRNLSSITISRNVTNIDIHAFHNCIGLIDFGVAPENTAFSALDGVLYNKNKTVIVRYPPNKVNTLFSIPATVTGIYGYAFRDCQRLSSVFVSGNVVTIGYGAFGWSKIQTITLSKSVNFIDIYAFCENEDLTNLTVYWNTPAEVTIQTPEWSWEDIFYNINKSSVTLHVPPGTTAAYKASDVWKDFNIVDNAVTGMAAIALPSSIEFYPNPTAGIVYTATESQIQVYNLHGALLQEVFGNQVDLSAYPEGMYILQINGVRTKVIKK